MSEHMTTRPMTEAEEAAERIIAWVELSGEGPQAAWPTTSGDAVCVARALLSSSAAERGMREALEALVGAADRYNSSGVYFNAGTNMEAALNKARAALSGIEGEDEQATRGEDGPTAPTDR